MFTETVVHRIENGKFGDEFGFTQYSLVGVEKYLTTRFNCTQYVDCVFGSAAKSGYPQNPFNDLSRLRNFNRSQFASIGNAVPALHEGIGLIFKIHHVRPRQLQKSAPYSALDAKFRFSLKQDA